MERRFDYPNAAPGTFKAMLGLERYLRSCDLEEQLLHLIKMRASQMNGCAYCLDMHSKDLRAGGESEHRIYLLGAWREASCYTDRERAALEWTEALTNVTDGHVPDDVHARVREQFDEREISDLSLAVVTINGWNRLQIASRAPEGEYQPSARASAAA